MTRQSLSLVLCMATLLYVATVTAALPQPPDVVDKLFGYQERLEKLSDAITRRQTDLLAQDQHMSVAYGQLELLSITLSIVTSDLLALANMLTVEELVTQESNIKRARARVDKYRAYVVRGLSNRLKTLENFLTKAADAETGRLLLDSRDALKEIGTFLERPAYLPR